MRPYIPEGATIQVRDSTFVAMFAQIDSATQAGLAHQRQIQYLDAVRDKARATHRLAKLDGNPSIIAEAKEAHRVAKEAHVRAVLEGQLLMGDLRMLRSEFWVLLTKLEPEAYDDRLPWVIQWQDSTDSLVVLKRVASEEERKEAMEAAMFGYHTGGGRKTDGTSPPKPIGFGGGGYL